MKNMDIIKNFIKNQSVNKRTLNLYVDETKNDFRLVNYSTIIAVIYKNDINTVYVNLKYYSNTTRKIQSYIIDIAREMGVDIRAISQDNIDNIEYINYKRLVNELFNGKVVAIYQYGGYETLQGIDIVHGIEDKLLFVYRDKLYLRPIKYDNNPYINFNGRCYLRDFIRV